MTLEQLAFMAEIVGAVAVVTSLIYLAIQIKNEGRLRRLSAANELASQWSALMTSIHDSAELSGILLRGLQNFDDLDVVSKFRFSAYFGRYLRNSEGLYLHALDGTLDPTIWRGIERSIADLIAFPGAQSWWKTRDHWYSDGFQQLVESLQEAGSDKPLYQQRDLESLA